jgi:anti-sigma factor RsiW
MSCEKYEQNLYLYDELSPQERAIIDEHVHTCIACRSLLEEIQQQSAWVKYASQTRPEPAHPQRLTNAILAQLSQPRTSMATKFLAPLDILFVRYSLAAVSLGLVVLFVSEQQQGSVVTKSMPRPAASATLNTNAFLQQYAQEKEQRQPAQPSWYQCLHDVSCAEASLEIRKQRKLSSL